MCHQNRLFPCESASAGTPPAVGLGGTTGAPETSPGQGHRHPAVPRTGGAVPRDGSSAGHPCPSLPPRGLMTFAFIHAVSVGQIPGVSQGQGLHDTMSHPDSRGSVRKRGCCWPCLPPVRWLGSAQQNPAGPSPQHGAVVPGPPGHVPSRDGAGAAHHPPGMVRLPWRRVVAFPWARGEKLLGSRSRSASPETPLLLLPGT